MTTKEKAEKVATLPASNTEFTDCNFTVPDPAIGWFDLAKPSRERQQKSAWKRGKQRGRIDAYLAAHLALLFTIGLLIVCGVCA